MKHINRPNFAPIARGLIALALTVSCGGTTSSTPIIGGETHFLRSCSESCGDGLSCIAGICTRSCLVAEASCGDLATAAICTASSVEPGAVAVCDVGCDETSDCSELGRDHTCQAGFCRAPTLASMPPSAAECPAFAAGVLTPSPIDTTTAPIPGAADVERALADATGLYWIDGTGAVFGLPRGASEPQLLSAAPPTPFVLTGLVSDGSSLYWGEATLSAGLNEPGPPPPPGRLRSVPKVGGPALVLAESETRVFAPLGVRGAQVISEVQTGDGGIFGVPVMGGEPVRLLSDTPSFYGLALRGDDIYYVEADDAPTLFRAPLAGGPPQLVTRIEGTEFEIGPGSILWKQGETTLDPLTLVENLVLLDEASGCVQALPSLGETVSVAGLDADHVYWKSYNGLGAFSPGDVPAPLPLVRVHLRTGTFERLSTPGFAATIVTDYLTEDESALYFRVDGEIVAVQKP